MLALAVGPQVRPGTYAAAYDHYSLLRTVEDALGLAPLAHARRAHAFAGLWAAGTLIAARRA